MTVNLDNVFGDFDDRGDVPDGHRVEVKTEEGETLQLMYTPYPKSLVRGEAIDATSGKFASSPMVTLILAVAVLVLTYSRTMA